MGSIPSDMAIMGLKINQIVAGGIVMMKRTYPELQIDMTKVFENVSRTVALCKKNGITVAGVVKGVNGLMGVTDSFVKGGCAQIASSRIIQLENTKRAYPNTETLLLRVPMASELDEMIRWSDISLNSERETIDRLEMSCAEQGIKHAVILMMDLGDLREGYFDANELIETAVYIEEQLKWVKLKGIGTNLGCYGAIKPTTLNLGRLGEVASEIEARIGRKLDIVSGGATSTLPLMMEGLVPSKINHLRLGESILLNMDLPEIWGVPFPMLHQDSFVLNAQIVEIKTKPSYPVGEIFIDAFGHTPEYEDKGIRKRAILAVGKQDFVMDDKLKPHDQLVQIIGSSSDHLIVDIEDTEKTYQVGDVMSFQLYYGPLLHLCTSEYVAKHYINPIE